MNMSKNLLKGFAAVAMLCMVGAVFATPVALGDITLYYEYKHLEEGHTAQAIGDDGRTVYEGLRTAGEGVSRLALVADAGEEAGLLAAGVATGGTALIAIGICVAA